MVQQWQLPDLVLFAIQGHATTVAEAVAWIHRVYHSSSHASLHDMWELSFLMRYMEKVEIYRQ